MVKIGEVCLSLEQVERVIKNEMGLVIRALLISTSQRLVIGCVINEKLSENWVGTCPTRPYVMKSLVNKLDPLAIPRVWRSIKDWPVNSQGKLDSGALLELFNV